MFHNIDLRRIRTFFKSLGRNHKTTKKKCLTIIAGGTGGHVFPGQAIAEMLVKRYDILWLTDHRGYNFISSEIKNLCNIKILPVTGYSGGTLQKLIFLKNMVLSIIIAIWHMFISRTKLAVGFGGYQSAPALLGAFFLRIPIVLHEQNAVAGRVNRFFYRFSKIFLTSFPATKPSKGTGGKVEFLGCPVRDQLRVARELYGDNARKIGQNIRIVVIGGSQGSRLLSKVIAPSILQLPAALQSKIEIWEQARSEDIEIIEAQYKGSQLSQFQVSPFFANIGSLLAQADLVIARAGGGTIAEILYLGIPSILIPLASSLDDHQLQNARFLAQKEAAIMIVEKDLDVQTLTNTLNELMTSTRLYQLKRAINLMRKEDSAAKIAVLLNKVIL